MSGYAWPERFWPHQLRGCIEVVAAAEAGQRRIIFTSPTGMGKSFCMEEWIKRACSEWQRCVLYTHRRLLLTQISRGLTESGIEHGMRASGYEPALLRDVQLAMTQTELSAVFRREKRALHEATLAIADEIHAQGGDTLPRIFKEHYDQGAVAIGVTATPIDLVGEWDVLVQAGTTSEGRACGALVPAYTYCPDEPDLKYIKNYRVGEDLTDKENAKVMMRPGVFGRVLTHYKRLNPDRKPTILFAPDVAGSLFFAESFHAEGVRAAHIDAKQIWLDGEYMKSGDEERDTILKMFRAGEIEVLTNRFVCVDEETEILTREGWVDIDGMTMGHHVANWDNGRVFFATPGRVIRRRRGEDDMAYLETPRKSIRVTASHDMLYRTTRDGRFLKATAGELVDRVCAVPVSGMAAPCDVRVIQPDLLANIDRRITSNAFAMRARGHNPATARAIAEERIRERAQLRRKHPYQLTLEECEFIGFWIGDGNANHLRSGGIEYRLTQSVKCPRIVARIDALLSSMRISVVRRIRTTKTTKGPSTHVDWSLCRGTGYGQQRRMGVYCIEPYLRKDGADLFWGLTEAQFTALIRGLWMADGFPHNDNTELPNARLAICGINSKLFDLLQAIATCRGWRASIRAYAQSNPKYTTPLLLLTMTKADEHMMTKYRLRRDATPKVERVWCVTTDSGNIITRRRGSVTVMGNCREGINLPEISHAIFACVFGSLRSHIQAGGRALRASPGVPFVTIQDHGGNYTRHCSLNEDHVWTLGMKGYKVTGLRQEAMRENPELEPIRCPRCGAMRLSGPKCHVCGHVCHKRSRVVVQVNGELKLKEGPKFRPHRTKMTDDAIEKWKSMYHRARSKKWNATFRQAESLFFRENGFWPPHDLPLMPVELADWFERVADCPRERLQ